MAERIVRERTAIRLGKGQSCFTGSGKDRAAFDSVFEVTKNSILESHYWSFAEKFEALQKAVSPPLAPLPVVYKLPPDFLHVTFVVPTANPYSYGDLPYKAMSGDYICSGENAHLSYTKELSANERLSAGFVEALATRLAVILCIQTTGDMELHKKLEKEHMAMEYHSISNDYRDLDHRQSVEPQDMSRARTQGTFGDFQNSEEFKYQVKIPVQPIDL